MVASYNRRPLGATVLALVLGWLAMGGFGNAIAWWTIPSAFDEPLPARLASFVEAVQSPLFTLLAVAYGATALIAAVGIWRLRSWMSSAFLAWSAAVIALFAWMLLAVPYELPDGGGTAIGLFGLLVVGLLALAHRYVANLSRSCGDAAL